MIIRLLTPLLLWLLLLFSVGVCPTFAADSSQEYQLKAGFLVNFIRFMTWPDKAFATSDADIVLCVVGINPFGGALSGVNQKKIGQRKIRVVYAQSLESVPLCHLLYISQSMEKKLDALHARLADQSLVSVSDISGFAKFGGGIEFISKKNRLSFIINYSALKKRNIQVRASLLELAVSVY